MIAAAYREDDQLLISQAIQNLDITNSIQVFHNGQQLLDYVSIIKEQPFVILCDINMPIMGEMELSQRIEANHELRKKAISSIFLTTDASPGLMNEG